MIWITKAASQTHKMKKDFKISIMVLYIIDAMSKEYIITRITHLRNKSMVQLVL